MQCKTVTGIGLVTLVAAPLAFSDILPRRPYQPAPGTYTRGAVFLRADQDKGVHQSDVTQKGDVYQNDVAQKGDIRQRSVDYNDVAQKGASFRGTGTAVNNVDMLLEFYAGQRDEAAMLNAQADRFASMGHDNHARMLRQMAMDHSRLADQASGLLQDRTNANVTLAPRPRAPFVSNSAIEMIDHDIAHHQRAIAKNRTMMNLARMTEARELLSAAVAGSENHLQMLQQARAEMQGGRSSRAVEPGPADALGLAASTEASSQAPKDDKDKEEKGAPTFTEKGFTAPPPPVKETQEVVVVPPPPAPMPPPPAPIPPPPAPVAEVPPPPAPAPPVPFVQAPPPVPAPVRPAH